MKCLHSYVSVFGWILTAYFLWSGGGGQEDGLGSWNRQTIDQKEGEDRGYPEQRILVPQSEKQVHHQLIIHNPILIPIPRNLVIDRPLPRRCQVWDLSLFFNLTTLKNFHSFQFMKVDCKKKKSLLTVFHPLVSLLVPKRNQDGGSQRVQIEASKHLLSVYVGTLTVCSAAL